MHVDYTAAEEKEIQQPKHRRGLIEPAGGNIISPRRAQSQSQNRKEIAPNAFGKTTHQNKVSKQCYCCCQTDTPKQPKLLDKKRNHKKCTDAEIGRRPKHCRPKFFPSLRRNKQLAQNRLHGHITQKTAKR